MLPHPWPYLPLTRIHPGSMIACPHSGQYRMCPHLAILCSQVSAACLLLLLLPVPVGVGPHPHGGGEAGEAVHGGAAGDTTV